MGTLYKNIDDLKILKDLFPESCEIKAADDKDIYGDGKQAGQAYYLYGDTFLLVPVKSKYTTKTIGGEREFDCIAWDVHVCYRTGGSYMEPPDWEEKELLMDAAFHDAVLAIHQEMLRCEISNCLEGYDYMNIEADAEMEPYA